MKRSIIIYSSTAIILLQDEQPTDAALTSLAKSFVNVEAEAEL